jgi:hypothetical protein
MKNDAILMFVGVIVGTCEEAEENRRFDVLSKLDVYIVIRSGCLPVRDSILLLSDRDSIRLPVG